MTSDFSVVFKFNRKAPAVFQGTADHVVQWLKEQTDVQGYEIFSTDDLEYFTVADFLKEYGALKNLVPKYYVLNPETEDMLPSGRVLKNGMKVLVEDPDRRQRPENFTKGDWARDWILVENRWCTVTHFTFTDRNVQFIAVYDDGTKRQRKVPADCAWIVKKDSVKAVNDKHDAVRAILEKVYNAAEEHSIPDFEKLTKKILGLL